MCAPKSDTAQEAVSTSVKNKPKTSGKKTNTDHKKVKSTGAEFRPYKDPKDLRKECTWTKRVKPRSILRLIKMKQI